MAAVVVAVAFEVAHAVELPTSSPVPGGVAVLPLGPAPARPQALNDQGIPVLVLGSTSGWSAVVGIPLAAKPGPGAITVRQAGRPERRVSFRIVAKHAIGTAR